MELRKTCIRMTMKTGTGLDYFRSRPIFDFLQTVKDFVEVLDEINAAMRKAGKKK